MRWIFFPPVISLVFLIITTLFHDRMAAMPLPSQIWGMTVGAYVCLCALSLYHLVRDEDKYNAGLSALAQGLIISVMSLQLGVMFMSWIGLVLFLTGLLITFFYATRESAQIPMLAPMIAAEESDDTPGYLLLRYPRIGANPHAGADDRGGGKRRRGI